MYLINFKEDLISIILSNFKRFEVDFYDPQNPPLRMNESCKRFIEIFGDCSRERILLRQFINFQQKYLQPFPWKIKLSSKLKNYKHYPYGAKVDFFINEAQQSSDLMGFLSKKSIFAFDEDNLLNCWSIHHIHLSDEYEDGGKFYKRSNYLLMIHQAEDTLYLLDVVPHNDKMKEPESGKEVNLAFSRTSIIKTLIKEFPKVSDKWKLHGILGLSTTIDDFGHRHLRKNGIQTMIEVDGAVYSPGYGISTAATGLRTTIETDKYMSMLFAWEKHIDENHESIFKDLGLALSIERPAQFRLEVREDGFIVYEAKSKTLIRSMSERKYFNRFPMGMN